MTTYNKTERRQWRHALKRFQWRINYVLALLALLAAILVQTTVASAAPRCPGGQANGYGQCAYRVDRYSNGYWPMLIDGQPTAVGVRQTP